MKHRHGGRYGLHGSNRKDERILSEKSPLQPTLSDGGWVEDEVLLSVPHRQTTLLDKHMAISAYQYISSLAKTVVHTLILTLVD